VDFGKQLFRIVSGSEAVNLKHVPDFGANLRLSTSEKLILFTPYRRGKAFSYAGASKVSRLRAGEAEIEESNFSSIDRAHLGIDSRG
jgi:hypothetical protein